MDYNNKPSPTKPGERPCPHVSPLGIYTTKFCLRLIQFVLAIAVAGLVGSTMQAGFWALGTLIVSAPATVVSICWSLSEMICIYVRAGHRGIHPGACVGVDLLLWLAFIAAASMLSLLGIATSVMASVTSTSSDWSDFNRDRDPRYDDTYQTANDVTQTLEGVVAKGQALIGLTATLVILHFTTFVIACYETNVRNRKKYAIETTVIYQTSTTTNHSMVPITHVNTPGGTYTGTPVKPIYAV